MTSPLSTELGIVFYPGKGIPIEVELYPTISTLLFYRIHSSNFLKSLQNTIDF